MTGAALVSAVVVSGCEADYPVQEPSPEPETTVSEPAPVAAPGDVDECFAVADAYLSVTLLGLEAEPDGDDEALGPRTLGEAADSIDDALASLPEDVRSAFRDAAEELRSDGDGLSPQELMDVRDVLEPVPTWLNDHCSTLPVEEVDSMKVD